MEVFTVVIRSFETPQRTVKKKFQLVFSFNMVLGREGLSFESTLYISYIAKCLHNESKIKPISLIKPSKQKAIQLFSRTHEQWECSNANRYY